MAVGGAKVDLEVSGVQDNADGRMNGERNAVHQRMRHADRHDAEWPKGHAAAGKDFDELGVVEEAMLFKLAFDIGQGELRAVDGDVEFGKNPGKTADVVFVSVCKDDPAHHRAVFDEVGNVGDDDVDSEQLFFGKHEAGVDDDDVVAEAEGEAVHAELTQTAERNDLQFC